MQPLKNQRIIANAGSGKTYRLVSRYLELLKREVPAERVIALTFTRKAAGEFLDRIFQRLCDGLETGDRESGLTGEECAAHLRQLIDKLPRLTLGTLDSFFGRMVRAFPFECGLAGEITLMDGHALNMARREALDALFRGQTEETAFAAFLDLIRQQNRNSEGRDVTEALAREIDALHEGFLMTPPECPWGEAEAIWPGGAPPLEAPEVGGLVDAFESRLGEGESEISPEYHERWRELLVELRSLRAGSTVPERSLKFALRAIDPPPLPKEPGKFYLTVYGNKRFVFPERDRDVVVALGRAVLRVEIEGRLARSRALYELVEHFERPYQRLVRDSGRLTFSDITGLLAAAEGATWRAGTQAGAFDRQQMDYRLDATYDHWLLDEFQDTSRLQWQALRNLVDEVVQSDTGRRSFFYVGDTKQAIYTWRGGDPWLFDEIAEYYNASGTERIDTGEALDISRRSSPEILDVVNRVFDPARLERFREFLDFPDKTLERWRNAWREHQPHKKEPGCVRWRTVEAGGEGKRAALDREAARLIAEVNPAARGLSCAVLVQTNAHAASIVEALRAAGLEARSEGRFNPCTDNDLGAACISLLRAIAHPADKFSRRHVEMTPLWALVEGDFEGFRLEALRLIRSEGFAGALTRWLDRLALRENPFALGRAGDLLRAAAEFDAAYCGGTIDDLVAQLQNRASVDDLATGAVRVLTVHASKGLDFDLVVLPDVDEGALTMLRSDQPVHLHTERDGRIAWGLDLPPKAVCETDGVLRGAYEKALAEETYENLCVHYVAMTRAKRALYIVSEKLGEKTTARTFNRLLHEALERTDGEFLVGDAQWYLTAAAKEEEPMMEILPLETAPVEELRRETPSRGAPGRFAFAGGDKALALGAEVHALLAQISWTDDAAVSTSGVTPEAGKLVAAFLKTEAGGRIFGRPQEAVTLWREQAFEVVVDGRWISGVFDRVVIREGRAEIFDFKTDDISSPSSAEQMRLYREALSALTGIAVEGIEAALVSVKTGERILIPLS